MSDPQQQPPPEKKQAEKPKREKKPKESKKPAKEEKPKTAAASPAADDEESFDPAAYKANRTKVLTELQSAGKLNPWPHKWNVTMRVPEFVAKYESLTAGQQSEDVASVAGRVMSRRAAGSSLAFFDLWEQQTKIQVLANQKAYAPGAADSKDRFTAVVSVIRRGDIIGARGRPARSKTGELSIVPEEMQLLSPCLAMLPKSWFGLSDQETRYRQRYLDLILNRDVASNFSMRAGIIRHVRRFLDDRGFLEVETPILNMIPGGATAKPFVTHHNELNLDMFRHLSPPVFFS